MKKYNLKIGTCVGFICGMSLIEGYIKEKINSDDDILFLIETDMGDVIRKNILYYKK